MNNGSPNRYRYHRIKGFTLIELLVVIVIIATLAGLGFMGFTRVRERAKSAVSANNLRQWGQALMLYTGDKNGMVPYEGDRDRVTWANIANAANQNSWFNVLPPYVGQKPMGELTAADRQTYTQGYGIHFCPLVQWRDWRRPAFSYMMNSQIYNPEGPSNSPDIPIRMSAIKEPSATVMFADVNQAYNDRPRGRGNHVDNRHNNNKNVNLVFFDGSMRAFNADYVKKDTFSAGGVNYTDNNKPDLIWNPWIHPRTASR